MQFVVTERIDAPREAVFDIISDPRLRTRWQSSLRSVHMETDGPPRLGTRWHEHMRGGLRFELEINEFERPSRWSELAHGRFADARVGVGLRVGETPSTTTLVLTVELELAGLSRFAAPALRAVMPSALRADLRRMESLARSVRASRLEPRRARLWPFASLVVCLAGRSPRLRISPERRRAARR